MAENWSLNLSKCACKLNLKLGIHFKGPSTSKFKFQQYKSQNQKINVATSRLLSILGPEVRKA